MVRSNDLLLFWLFLCQIVRGGHREFFQFVTKRAIFVSDCYFVVVMVWKRCHFVVGRVLKMTKCKVKCENA